MHILSKQQQRDKQLDERKQANFRAAYLNHVTESAYMGVRHFANPLILKRKRKKPKHSNLNEVISYLYTQKGWKLKDNDIEMKTQSINNINRKRSCPNPFQRKRKRRKLRHTINQLRNDQNKQKTFYDYSKYSNKHNIDTNNHCCLWNFNHQKNAGEEMIYESDFRCVLCFKFNNNIDSLQKHLICFHYKLSFNIEIINEYSNIINVECKPSNVCYSSFIDNNNNKNNKNIKLNEYYYGWINIWNKYYLKCNKLIRNEIKNQYFRINDNDNDIDIDNKLNLINFVYKSKWNFHSVLSLSLLSQQSSPYASNCKSSKDIRDTFQLSCNQFRNRFSSSLTNKEKLLIVEEVLSYPLMKGRIRKLSKYIGFRNVKILKKLMAIYPMLLLLNKRSISNINIAKWNQWKSNTSTAAGAGTGHITNITNNDLNQIKFKDIIISINNKEKGVSELNSVEKLWICRYILSNGGKSFISRFRNAIQNELNNNNNNSNDDNDNNKNANYNFVMPHFTNSSIYNIYYNFCGYMMLCGQFPLSSRGINILRQWWNEVKSVFSFGNSNSNSNSKQYRRNIKIASNKNNKIKKKKKHSFSRKRNIRLDEKVIAIRDIIYNEKDISEYCSTFDVKESTIIRWINNSQNILQKCEAELSLDDIWGIYTTKDGNAYDSSHTQKKKIINVATKQQQQQQQQQPQPQPQIEQKQFFIFLEKAAEYLRIRKPQKKRLNNNNNNNNNNNSSISGDDDDDSEYDPMNETASDRRVATGQHLNFSREYKTRNVGERRGRIESYELKFNRGFLYHGSIFSKVAVSNKMNKNDHIELEYDTELECDDNWLLKWENNLLFDFEDISYSEKTMMKFWNEFIRKQNKNKIYSSFMLPIKLIKFTKIYKNIIIKNNLKLPFLFHCITLWEFGFIQPKCIQDCMQIIHKHASDTSQTNINIT